MKNKKIFSKRAENIKSSLTLEISSLAKELSKRGQDICSLSAGEPDAGTPDFIIEAASRALKDGHTRYGPVSGDPELREAVARKLNLENNLNFKKENILISNGAKQSIYNLLQVLVDYGDEVIIPSPYWLSYPEMVKLAGGIPIFLESDAKNGFKFNFDALTKSINDSTKLLIINSPCNPTGNVLSKTEMEEILKIIKKHENIFILSDEIYEYIIEDSYQHYSIGSLDESMRRRIFTVNGFAKSYSMTGWRIGYLAGDENIIKKASSIQSQSTSNVCTFAQRGALEALNIKSNFIKESNTKYNKRRSILFKGIETIDELYLHPPKGAFYAFPKIISQKISSLEFCKIALNNFGLVLIPGIAFGDDNCVRISLATSEAKIKDGIERLIKTFSYLKT